MGEYTHTHKNSIKFIDPSQKSCSSPPESLPSQKKSRHFNREIGVCVIESPNNVNPANWNASRENKFVQWIPKPQKRLTCFRRRFDHSRSFSTVTTSSLPTAAVNFFRCFPVLLIGRTRKSFSITVVNCTLIVCM